ncbi:MAG: quinolinate synthase [Candidatus Diapherotrites archaeon CG08_land_8_20_14_0_20_34_12]|nr:MAG: quinolinate synthase [Candidatus Diapherotrites archaeon CG08_land_8_20_14_0_20_34_12]
METKKLQAEILRLKKEKNAVILSHNYQIAEIQDVADFVGDSLELAFKAKETNADLIVLCGVDFMAEIAKIVNPAKKVLWPNKKANCPMAAMLKPEDITEARKKYPNAKVVLYVNCSAECKKLADCCCTSANAVKIVDNMDSDIVLFGPDKNLAEYVAEQIGKKVIPVPANGFCSTHQFITKTEIEIMKEKYSNAKVIAHPECTKEVRDAADYIASTSGMIKVAKESDSKEFIVATENGLLHRLRKEIPNKKFYPVSETAICGAMKEIKLEDVYNALKNEEFEVKLDKGLIDKAYKPLDCMLKITQMKK